MTERSQQELGPISKLVKFFCPDVEDLEIKSDEYQWYLLTDWDTQINRKSDSEKHPWLVEFGVTPAGFIRWNRSTTRSGNAPSRLYQKPHTHFGCSINEEGWVQVGDPQIRGAHLLSKSIPICEESDSDWLHSFRLCRNQIAFDSKKATHK
jgi:hypothetical protein